MRSKDLDDIVPIDQKIQFRRIMSMNPKELKLRQSSSMSNVKFEKIHVNTHRQKKIIEHCEECIKLLNSSLACIDLFLTEKRNKNILEEHTTALAAQRKVLEMRELQYSMLIYVLENQKSSHFAEHYAKIYGDMDKFSIPQSQLEKPINLTIIEVIHKKEFDYLVSYQMHIKDLTKCMDTASYSYIKYKIMRCKVFSSKIYTISEVYSCAMLNDPTDLFSENLNTSQRWEKMRSITTVRILGDKKAIKSSLQLPMTGINRLNATLSKLNELSKATDTTKRDGIVSALGRALKALDYVCLEDKAQTKAEIFLAEPDKATTVNMFNLPESNFVKPIIGVLLPHIKFVKLIYIPRHFEPLALERTREWVSKNDYAISKDPFVEPSPLANIEFYKEGLFRDTDDQDTRVRVRIISPYNLELQNRGPPGFFQKMSRFFSTNDIAKSNKIILHVHGGGFISQSSYIHQMYTRNWANQLGTAIFSVDYRLAPQYQYPYALDDCFQTYGWLIYYLNRIYDIQPDHIVLAGDSAGGNIVAALSGLIIKFNMKKPSGLVLVYPALNLSFTQFTPSVLSSLDDMLLPHTILKMCLECYVPEDYRVDVDPMVSPVRFSDEILGAFPPTRIFVGNDDAFHDECCRFAERLMNLKRDVKLVIYDHFIHGFLQMNRPFRRLDYAKTAIDEIRDHIGQLLRKC